MVTIYSHIIQYVGAQIQGILILVILQICNIYLLWSRYLSHTQPFLDTDPRPPACHMIMPRQTFTSFISNVTRHRYLISLQGYHHMPPGKESYPGTHYGLTLNPLPPFQGYLKHPLDLHLCLSLPYRIYNHSRHAKSLNSYHWTSFGPLRYKKATTKSRISFIHPCYAFS